MLLMTPAVKIVSYGDPGESTVIPTRSNPAWPTPPPIGRSGLRATVTLETLSTALACFTMEKAPMIMVGVVMPTVNGGRHGVPMSIRIMRGVSMMSILGIIPRGVWIVISRIRLGCCWGVMRRSIISGMNRFPSICGEFLVKRKGLFLSFSELM